MFDLQRTTARIKEATLHLKGVKIAIMGCIVDGLGEMADADFRYVGGAGQGNSTGIVNNTAVCSHKLEIAAQMHEFSESFD